MLLVKKSIDQEPPYLMRQICVLQWEEIKTKNSWAKHQLCGRGDNKINCYRRHESIYKFGLSGCLSVCLFLSNKRQNG